MVFAADCVFNIKPETATYKVDVMQTHLKECLTQNRFEPFLKIIKRSNNCKRYICRWTFDNSDLEKDKDLFGITDNNVIRTHNYLVRKQTRNHVAVT